MPQWLHQLKGLHLFCSALAVFNSAPPLLAYKYINYIRARDDLACMTSQLENI